MVTSSLVQEDAAPLQGLPRNLFLAELWICFGPCGAMALASPMVLGPALTQFLGKLFGVIAPINDVPWWAASQPIFLPVGAFAGLFALQAVARALLAGQAQLSYPPWATRLMALAGVAAIVVVGAQVVPDQPFGLPSVLCVYAPLLATAHILFMSRRLLFGAH